MTVGRDELVHLAGHGCAAGEPMVARLAFGLASPREAGQAQLHLAGCAQCGAALRAARRVARAGRGAATGPGGRTRPPRARRLDAAARRRGVRERQATRERRLRARGRSDAGGRVRARARRSPRSPAAWRSGAAPRTASSQNVDPIGGLAQVVAPARERQAGRAAQGSARRTERGRDGDGDAGPDARSPRRPASHRRRPPTATVAADARADAGADAATGAGGGVRAGGPGHGSDQRARRHPRPRAHARPRRRRPEGQGSSTDHERKRAIGGKRCVAGRPLGDTALAERRRRDALGGVGRWRRRGRVLGRELPGGPAELQHARVRGLRHPRDEDQARLRPRGPGPARADHQQRRPPRTRLARRGGDGDDQRAAPGRGSPASAGPARRAGATAATRCSCTPTRPTSSRSR